MLWSLTTVTLYLVKISDYINTIDGESIGGGPIHRHSPLLYISPFYEGSVLPK
jgi:hypothetical protein